MIETERDYWTRYKAEEQKDAETDTVVEALCRLLASPTALPSRSDIIEVLERYYSSDRRLNGYKRLFGRADSVRRDGGSDRYELVTSELIARLTNYFFNRKESLGITGRPLKILELGAGDGKLALSLLTQLKDSRPGQFIVKAVDNGYGAIPSLPIVENREADEALTTEQPDIVLMSWAPTDWTPLIRELRSVREYILIGDPVCCGVSPGEAYGAYGRSLVRDREPAPDFLWPEDEALLGTGFTHRWLEDISQIQLGYNWRGEEGRSRTISFRRTTTAHV